LSQAAENRRGIIAMLTAMTLFTGNDALLKIATVGLPPGQIMATRGVFGVLLALGLVTAMGESRHLRELAAPVVALRAAVEAAVAFTFITALGALELANITAILQATPIVLTVLTVLFGLERVGWRRWSAILVGFAGVLLVVKPSPDGFNLYAGLALLSATLVAVRDLLTRRIAGHVPTVVVTLSTTTTVTLLGVVLSFREEWRGLAVREVALLALAAGFVTLGNLAVIRAYRIGEMSVVSPFRYTVILTSLAVGYLTFGELPDAVAISGIALIVLSGVYTIHRDQMRRRAEAAPAPLRPGAAAPPAGERL
jgi:drug/metabolite transporter (DMT)-like permease